jgi:hypothetical protein
MDDDCEKCKDKARAPNKEDYIDLFKQVTAQPTKGKIDEAIR